LIVEERQVSYASERVESFNFGDVIERQVKPFEAGEMRNVFDGACRSVI
jgi:hypothetical protein